MSKQTEKENEVQIVFSRFDTMLGRYVLDKKVKTASPHDSLLKIGNAFLDDFCKHFEGADREALNNILKGLELESPKEVKEAAAGKVKTESSKPELPLYSIDKAGKASGLALLRSHAFDVGSTIAFEGEDKVWVIAGASGNFAELREPGKKDSEQMPIEDLVKGAKKASLSDVKVKHEHWPASRACHSTDSAKSFIKARVFFALEVLSKVVGDTICDQVDVFVKPSRIVTSKLHIPKGELVILPEGKVVINELGKEIPSGHHEVVCMDSPPGFEGVPCLVPSTSEKEVSPWCFVETKTLPSQVNMVPMFLRSR